MLFLSKNRKNGRETLKSKKFTKKISKKKKKKKKRIIQNKVCVDAVALFVHVFTKCTITKSINLTPNETGRVARKFVMNKAIRFVQSWRTITGMHV